MQISNRREQCHIPHITKMKVFSPRICVKPNTSNVFMPIRWHLFAALNFQWPFVFENYCREMIFVENNNSWKKKRNDNNAMPGWRENQLDDSLNYRDICMKMAFPCSRPSIKIAPAPLTLQLKCYQIDVHVYGLPSDSLFNFQCRDSKLIDYLMCLSTTRWIS